jgi:cytochrome b6-f complex iron-sulfur subunit
LLEGAFIAEVSDVPIGSAYYFKYGGDDVVLVNVGGEYRAFTRECTHAGCALSLDGGVLKCPCHGSQFDPLTGAVVKGPAQEPLTSVDVLVVEDKIYVG